MIITDLTVTALSSYYIEYWCQRILRNNALCFFRLRAPKWNPGGFCHPHPSLASHLQWQDPWGNCEPSLCLMACFHINGRRKHIETEPPSTIAKPNNNSNISNITKNGLQISFPKLVGLWQGETHSEISSPHLISPEAKWHSKRGLDLTLSVIGLRWWLPQCASSETNRPGGFITPYGNLSTIAHSILCSQKFNIFLIVN